MNPNIEGKIKYAKCSLCGQVRALSKKGNLRGHYIEDIRSNFPTRLCPGSFELHEDVVHREEKHTLV